MVDIDRKGRFFLGKEHDLEKGETVLLLAFPELDYTGFARWVPPAETAKKDMKYLDYTGDIEEHRIAPAAVKVKRFGVLWLATDG